MPHEITLPDATEMVLDFGDENPVMGYAIHAEFANGRGLQSVAIGPVGYLDDACLNVIPSSLRSRTVWGNFELRIAQGNDGLGTLSALRGPYHDVLKIFSGPPISDEQVALAYDGFDYEDSPNGVRVSLPRGSFMSLNYQEATVVVRNRGIVRALVGPNAKATLPPWQGTPTQFGQVWRTENEDGPPSFVVEFASAVAFINPGSQGKPAEAAWMHWLDSLSVRAA